MPLLETRTSPPFGKWRLVLLIVGILTSLSLALGETWADAAIVSQITQPVAPGVTYTSMVANSPGNNQAINVLTIDRGNPYIYMHTQLAANLVDHKEPVALQALKASQPGSTVVAAINGDFFTVATGTPIGLHVQAGEVMLSPDGYPAFTVQPNGQLSIAPLTLTMHVAQVNAAGEVVQSITTNSLNRPRGASTMAVYTPRFGSTTKTNGKGTEVVLQGVNEPLRAGQTYVGTVMQKQTGLGNAAIPPDGIVLSDSGPAQAFLNSLNVGDQVSISIDMGENYNSITEALSGRPVLVKAGKVADMSRIDALNITRHPRTSIGYNDKQIFLVTVDGRRPGYADGMTSFELAELMLSLGATEAVNLDGGGSTTFVVRRPGEAKLSVANRPSDGQERAVGNTLLVYCTAPQGSLAHLYVSPPETRALVGSQVNLAVAGQDEYYGPADLPEEGLQWEVDGAAGKVENGVFTALQAGDAVVKATVGNAGGSAKVTVVDHVSRIEIHPQTVAMRLGESVALAVKGFDATGRPVVVSPGLVQWSVEGNVGTVDAMGVLTATQAGAGKVLARLGSMVVGVPITVGQPPVVLSDFESADQWSASFARAAAAFELATAPDPVHAGTFSGKLSYDFTTGPAGTAAAYAEAGGRIRLEGRPVKIGVWVYGDGHAHWLRGNYYDGQGVQHVLDFTGIGGFNWTGWRYVEAPIDQNAPLPLEFQRIYVVETSNDKKDKGIVFFDDLTAVYGDSWGVPR